MIKVVYNENIFNSNFRYRESSNIANFNISVGDTISGVDLFGTRSGGQAELLCFGVGGTPLPSCGGNEGTQCPEGYTCNIIEQQTQGGTAAAGIGSLPRGCCWPNNLGETTDVLGIINDANNTPFISADMVETYFKDSSGTKTVNLELPGFTTLGVQLGNVNKFVSSETSKIIDSVTSETVFQIQDGITRRTK